MDDFAIFCVFLALIPCLYIFMNIWSLGRGKMAHVYLLVSLSHYFLGQTKWVWLYYNRGDIIYTRFILMVFLTKSDC